MAAVTIRNLSDETHRALKHRAKLRFLRSRSNVSSGPDVSPSTRTRPSPTLPSLPEPGL
jgi:hypothetical protein